MVGLLIECFLKQIKLDLGSIRTTSVYAVDFVSKLWLIISALDFA